MCCSCGNLPSAPAYIAFTLLGRCCSGIFIEPPMLYLLLRRVPFTFLLYGASLLLVLKKCASERKLGLMTSPIFCIDFLG